MTKHEKEVAKLQRQASAVIKTPSPPSTKPPSAGKKQRGSIGSSILNVGLPAGTAIDLDEGENALSVPEQIASALRASAGRVLDLFREWDTNGDGEVSREKGHT